MTKQRRADIGSKNRDYLAAKDARLFCFAACYVLSGDPVSAYLAVWPGANKHKATNESARMLGLPNANGRPTPGFGPVLEFVRRCQLLVAGNGKSLDLDPEEMDKKALVAAYAGMTDPESSGADRSNWAKLYHALRERQGGTSGPISTDSLLTHIRDSKKGDTQDESRQ